MYKLHENKTRIHGNNRLFLIPPPSCSAMCSKYIKLIYSSVKSKLECGTQDNQVTPSVSLHKFIWYPKMQAVRQALYSLFLLLSVKSSESLT